MNAGDNQMDLRDVVPEILHDGKYARVLSFSHKQIKKSPPPTIGVFGPNSRDFLHMPVPVVTFHAIWLPHCHQFP